MNGESEEAREARVKMELLQREREMRLRRPAEDERRGGGHAAKAGFRGTTALLVVLAVLASLWLLQRASKRLDLGSEPRRPGVGDSRR
jgi:hypothetical protein